MNKKNHSWKSPSLGKEMKVSVYGTSGTPVIIFPSEEGDRNEWEETGMIDSLQEQIREGYNQFFCVDSVADISLLNKESAPARRIRCQEHYEQYIIDELIPFIKKQNNNSFLLAAGAFLGAYYSLLFALKNPGKINKVIGISGNYDIKPYLDGFYDESVYFNNPVDFLPNLSKHPLIEAIKTIDIRLLSYANDPQQELSRRISDTLWVKNIEHNFYVWDESVSDPWDLVDSMFIEHLY